MSASSSKSLLHLHKPFHQSSSSSRPRSQPYLGWRHSASSEQLDKLSSSNVNSSNPSVIHFRLSTPTDRLALSFAECDPFGGSFYARNRQGKEREKEKEAELSKEPSVWRDGGRDQSYRRVRHNS